MSYQGEHEGHLVRQNRLVNETSAAARFGNTVATGLVEVSRDPAVLETHGRWAVLVRFEGECTFARFQHWRERDQPSNNQPNQNQSSKNQPNQNQPDHTPGTSWNGPKHSDWSSSISETQYRAKVDQVRTRIAEGKVYQVNLCRILSAQLPTPDSAHSDIAQLSNLLASGNPARYSGFIRIPDQGIEIATASPELFLRRDGNRLTSGPIKGTAGESGNFLEKDHAENIMIVDLVRNDLGRVCIPGSVTVPGLLSTEPIPGGITHLVSFIKGTLEPETTWSQILAALAPAGSISGAPKSSALQLIKELEPTSRGPYCGAIGWVDADTNQAELAVGIRTFWITRSSAAEKQATQTATIHFGTGAGITWGSDPQQEWAETELKARHLISLASGTGLAAGDNPVTNMVE